MVVDYINTKLAQPERNLEEEEIAEIMDTSLTGTHFHNFENINSVTSSFRPSLEFVAEDETHELSDIRKEIGEGRPVIVWIRTIDDSRERAHSVVIVGIDDEKKEITYNDSLYGEAKTITQTQFIDIWEVWGSVMIKAEIGRVTTEPIEKYLQDGLSHE